MTVSTVSAYDIVWGIFAETSPELGVLTEGTVGYILGKLKSEDGIIATDQDELTAKQADQLKRCAAVWLQRMLGHKIFELSTIDKSSRYGQQLQQFIDELKAIAATA